MIKIIVGSKNPVKINCVREVFSKYFKNIDIKGIEVNSRVSHQPKSGEKTIQGAKNRAHYIFRKYQPDFAVGLEGGLEWIDRDAYVISWVCIKSKQGKVGLGRSASFPLPKKLEKLIKKEKELGKAVDVFFNIKNAKQKMGVIGLLSKGVLDRKGLYVSGVVSALLPFLNEKLYVRR